MDYTVKVAQYWGHVPGTIRGLSTVSKLFNSTEVRFPWGTHWKGDLEDGVDVGTDLQPGTKVLVKVQVRLNLFFLYNANCFYNRIYGAIVY